MQPQHYCYYVNRLVHFTFFGACLTERETLLWTVAPLTTVLSGVSLTLLLRLTTLVEEVPDTESQQ